MKKIVSILAMTIFAANLIFINGEPSNQSDKGIQPDKQVIIKKRKKIDDQFHRRYFPSKEIMGYVSFGRNSLMISLPLEGDYFDIRVKNEMTGMEFTTISTDASEIMVPFDGTTGEYFLQITTNDSLYEGYFSID